MKSSFPAPPVIKREIDGKWHEPFETLYLEVPDEAVGGCVQSLANRKGTTGGHEHKKWSHDHGDHNPDPRPDWI
jgi:predicted membrane GTPase involved in stress response